MEEEEEEGAAAHNTNCFPHATLLLLINPSIHIRETALPSPTQLSLLVSPPPPPLVCPFLIAFVHAPPSPVVFDDFIGGISTLWEMYCPGRPRSKSASSALCDPSSVYAVGVSIDSNVLEPSMVIERGGEGGVVTSALFTLSTVDCVIDWPINCNWGHAGRMATSSGPSCRKC